MGSSFLITLREGLEASLILAILITYLNKTGRKEDSRNVWLGAGSAIVACLVAGTLIYVFVNGLSGKVEQAVEGSIATAAVIVLTQMVFWMRANAKELSADLRSKVDASQRQALFVIAFVAVVREGLETVLFLLGAETSTAKGSSVVIGGLLGLVASVILGVFVFVGGRRVNMKQFFNVTAVLLLLFGAGLAGKAAHEFRELLGFESGWLIASAWNVESGMWSSGTFYDFVKGLFGWVASPERVRVIAYFLYLIPVIRFYRRKPNEPAVEVAQVA